jgi:hypothetical protein
VRDNLELQSELLRAQTDLLKAHQEIANLNDALETERGNTTFLHLFTLVSAFALGSGLTFLIIKAL